MYIGVCFFFFSVYFFTNEGVDFFFFFFFCDIGVSITSSRGPICFSLIGPSYILIELNTLCP
jgi:hypothetical protein